MRSRTFRHRPANFLPSQLRAGLLAASLLAVPPLWFHSTAGTAKAGLAGPVTTSTKDEQPGTSASDQVDLAVTVYNSNIALVRDVRQLALPTGDFRLRFMDIAATINPATVHLRSLNEPSHLGVVEQNYEYDLLEPQKLLQKYVGRELTLVRAHQENATTKWEEVKATLLAYNNGPVWKIGNEIVTGLSADSYRFPELPENLYSRPTLLWELENSGAPRQRVEASYLAGNISWSADYVLTVGRDDKSADLDGWVTLVNNTGTAFKNARLQLVAGDLHRVMESYGVAGANAKAMLSRAEQDRQFAQEAFSEYHLYTLGRRTSIFDKESKQISLLNATGVPVGKAYVVEGQQFYYHNYQHPGSPFKDPVKVYFKFKNEEKGGLGMPMPAGTVRVYQADSKGGVQFVGEDHISHTPKDETLSLHIGNAFDVVSERKQTDFKRVSDHLYEMEFEITLRNHKDVPITVEVDEPIGGDWEMLHSTHKWSKTAAWAAQFQVPVAKDGMSVLRYRIRAHW
ncbi:MAG TPA: DUF4139 domain-containing protein [Candidatus Acidoferrales bacterium]|nr:DUF4139 domain-containing protein [Candidatus Acidoferrales bacterium]